MENVVEMVETLLVEAEVSPMEMETFQVQKR